MWWQTEYRFFEGALLVQSGYGSIYNGVIDVPLQSQIDESPYINRVFALFRNQMVQGKYSVDVRAFINLDLERYINDSVIDTAIARLHQKCTFKKSVLCLPPHTTTWLDTGDGDFIHECFQEKLLDVKPEMLCLILLPVKMSDMHWGLMVLDVRSKEAFFDDGLKWTFPRISYVHQIMREVHSEFPVCDNFSSKQWRSLETFKSLGMPRQPSNGQFVGSGSCGVGGILSARDFLMSDQPVQPSWTFDEMTFLRKEIMKLLSL